MQVSSDQIGGTRKVVLARELTKRFEEFLRGTLEDAVDWVQSNNIRGEFCIVLEGEVMERLMKKSVGAWWKYRFREHVAEID